MAVGIRLKFAGGTQEQYQAVHDTVNADDPLGRADGCIVHSAGPIDGGWGIIDFRSPLRRSTASPKTSSCQSSNSSATEDFRTRRSARTSRSTTSSSTATECASPPGCPQAAPARSRSHSSAVKRYDVKREYHWPWFHSWPTPSTPVPSIQAGLSRKPPPVLRTGLLSGRSSGVWAGRRQTSASPGRSERAVGEVAHARSSSRACTA